jgi:hypothetical protein
MVAILVRAAALSLLLVLIGRQTSRAEADPKQEAIYTDASLVKEFPLSVQIRHQKGAAFVDTKLIEPSQLEALRRGKHLDITLHREGVEKYPQTVNHLETNNGFTKESLITYLEANKDKQPSRHPNNNFRHIDGNNPRISGAYPGWDFKEVIYYNNWFNKQHFERYDSGVAYVSSVDVLLEIKKKHSTPPESFSNRLEWEAKGLKTRKQDGSNCGLFSFTAALEAILIERGVTNPLVSPDEVWKNYNRVESDNKGRYKEVDTQAVIQGTSQFGVTCGTPKSLLPSPLTIRNCYNFMFSPSEFPHFIKKALKALDKTLDHDLATGFRDLLIKHEVSKKRPVLLSFFIPDGQYFDQKHKRDGQQTIVIRPKSYPGKVEQHSVLIVGYKPDPDDPSATLYEFLNSWGSSWGNRGYAWVSSKYIESFEERGIKMAAYSLSSAKAGS